MKTIPNEQIPNLQEILPISPQKLQKNNFSIPSKPIGLLKNFLKQSVDYYVSENNKKVVVYKNDRNDDGIIRRWKVTLFKPKNSVDNNSYSGVEVKELFSKICYKKNSRGEKFSMPIMFNMMGVLTLENEKMKKVELPKLSSSAYKADMEKEQNQVIEVLSEILGKLVKYNQQKQTFQKIFGASLKKFPKL